MCPIQDNNKCCSSPIYKIINARLLKNHEIVEGSYLWFQNGKIIDPQSLFFDHLRDADKIIDAKGQLVVPGFIDTQINGAYGIDFADYEGSDEKIQADINKVAKGLLQYGCTSFCPTVVSSEPAVYQKVNNPIFFFILLLQIVKGLSLFFN